MFLLYHKKDKIVSTCSKRKINIHGIDAFMIPPSSRSIVHEMTLLEDECFKRVRDTSARSLVMRALHLEARAETFVRVSSKHAVWGNALLRCLRTWDTKRTFRFAQCLRRLRKSWIRRWSEADAGHTRIWDSRFNRKTTGPLLRVLDPRTNLREVLKNAMLLRDHLEDKGKRCADCIRKHTLLMEAYVEEALSLDTKQHYHDVLGRVRGLIRTLWAYVDSRHTYASAVGVVDRIIRTTQGFATPSLRKPTHKK